MHKTGIITGAALALAATAATAAPFAETLAAEYQAQGYTMIEIDTGSRYVEVEAIRGDRKVEVLYDALTGAVLWQEVSRPDHDDWRGPGLRIRHDDDLDLAGDGDHRDDDDDRHGHGHGHDDDDRHDD